MPRYSPAGLFWLFGSPINLLIFFVAGNPISLVAFVVWIFAASTNFVVHDLRHPPYPLPPEDQELELLFSFDKSV